MNQIIMRLLTESSLEVIRRDDLLVLRFEFVYMHLAAGADGFQYLQPSTPGQDGHMLVHFQPQAFAEPIATPQAQLMPPVRPVFAAGDTQLAFKMPVARLPMRVTLENLLSWSGLQPMLANVALTAQQLAGMQNRLPQPEDPSNTQVQNDWTFIEAPCWLMLSPDSDSSWQHQTSLQSTGVTNETELWHTALKSSSGTAVPQVRAVWSPDYTPDFVPKPPSPVNNPTELTLTADDRNQIVHLTSDYKLNQLSPSPVAAINTDQMMLTALGSWMRLRGDWPVVGVGPATKPYSISAWHTRSTMGREHYVMLVKEGHLFPYGHRAAFVEITERSLGDVMFLQKSTYVVVKQPNRDLTAAHVSPPSTRQMPFSQIEILTRNTPVLDSPPSGSTFWPLVAGKDFLFDIAATDIAGQISLFQTPLYFIEDTQTITAAQLQTINASIAGKPVIDLRGQAVAMVPPTVPGGPVDTAYPATSASFLGALDGDYPGFVPVMDHAWLTVPAIHHLTDQEAPIRVSYTPDYLKVGIQDNAVSRATPYAEIKQGAPTLSFPSGDKSGGLMQPKMVLTHLAQSVGISPGTFAAGTAKQIFGDFGLLGGISLGDILPALPGPDVTPKITTSTSSDNTATTTMVWNLDHSTLVSSGPFVSSAGTTLNLNLKRVQGLSTAGNTTTLRCDLANFTLNLLDIIEVSFNSFHFGHDPGQKPKITVDVNQTTFNPPLDFVQKLASLVPGNGFSNPPTLDLTPAGATLGYSLTIPPFSLGAFSMENISLGCALKVPFSHQSIVFSFHFADADHPFLMTGDLVAGGGYCALELTANGLQRLDAALQFGGNAQLDLGVASGGVTVTGGFHFGYVQSTSTTDYTVFVQASGALEVLDLIAVSTEFYVGLDYQTSHTFTGTASLKVEVSVLFFHKSVSLTMQKSYTS